MMQSPEPVYVWHPKVACRTLDGTAFVLSGSRMVSLNGSGTELWQLFEQGTTAAGVAEHLCREYEVSLADATRDAEGFIHSLVERHMLVARPAAGAVGNGGSR